MNRHSLNLTLSLALGTLVACGGPAGSSADDDAIGEGAAYLVSADTEEAGEDSSDEPSVAGADDAEIDAMADESADELGGDVSVDGPEGCNFGAARDRILGAFDTDGDGQLDPDERAALMDELGDASRARRLRVLARHVRHHRFARARWAFDLDGDHLLDDAERAEFVAAMESRCEARRTRALAQYDSDGDGALDASERAAARQARAAALRDRWTAFVARHDTDGDGQLSRAERRSGAREELRAQRDRIRAHFDADGDGALSTEEREALKAAVRERIASGGRLMPA